MTGKIVKGIAGFYYVHVPEQGVYECKARGIFRKDGIKPLVGDDVELAVLDGEEMEGSIERILPRTSSLIRPAVANIDQALLLFAVERPAPNCNLLDRFLIMMGQQGLSCIICFNKADLQGEAQQKELESVYGGCGCSLLFTSARQKKGLSGLKALLRGKTTAVAGPSGVGKSTLINALQTGVHMETGSVSEKIGRGRHTTRHSEFIWVEKDTYIMDTPGFTSLKLFDMEKEELKNYYPEFAVYEQGCRFQGCLHLKEPDCAVKASLAAGNISRVRYDNYVSLYEELKNTRRY